MERDVLISMFLNIGAAKAVYYDIFALRECIRYIKENKIENPIVYILACRIGHL